MIPCLSIGPRPTKFSRTEDPDLPPTTIQNDNNVQLVQPPSIIAEEVEKILLRHPELINPTDELRGILIAMLEASVENKTLLDFRNPRKAQLQLILNARRQDFLAYCESKQLQLRKDEMNDPLVFSSVNVAALYLAGEQRIQQMKQTIQICRGSQTLMATPQDSIQDLFNTCTKEQVLISNIRTKLNYLKGRTGMPPDVLALYELNVQHTGREGRPLRIRIANDQNLLMGYSIFDLLYSIQIRSGDYCGEMEYILNDEEAEKLNTYLSSLVTWIDDFTNILADLLGPNEDPIRYIELAQRTRREIMEHPIRMSAGVLKSLRTSNLPICLIMGHLSLNLAAHPHRDFLKAKFQELYDSEKILDSAGEPKHFHIDEPYRSNIGIIQLRSICPSLNKLIKLQQLTTKFTGINNLETAINTLRSWGVANELQLVIQYKVQTLLETYRTALGVQTPHNTAFKIDQKLANLDQLNKVETESLSLCKKLLTHHMAPFFRISDAEFTPTSQHILALYDGNPKIRYEGNQLHKNVAVLFTKLKSCAVFKAALEANRATLRGALIARNATLQEINATMQAPSGLSEALTELKDELISRLNRYHTLSRTGYYGQEMVDETVRYFEQYVARIVYAQESKVTPASIERSFQVLSAIVGSDMHNGCSQGFSGRIKNILTALTRETGDDLRDHIVQFQKECLEDAFQSNPRYRDGGENSMLARRKGELSEYLGLSVIENEERVSFADLSEDSRHFLQLFLQKCTSWALYTKAYQFLTDKFWQLNSERDDEGIYQLLETLGFQGSHDDLDKNYRVNGDAAQRWQYAFFQQDLPRHLIGFLKTNQYLTVKPVGEGCNYLQRDGEELIQLQEAAAPPQEAAEPEIEIADANPRRFGYVPESALPTYDRMTS